MKLTIDIDSATGRGSLRTESSPGEDTEFALEGIRDILEDCVDRLNKMYKECNATDYLIRLSYMGDDELRDNETKEYANL